MTKDQPDLALAAKRRAWHRRRSGRVCSLVGQVSACRVLTDVSDREAPNCAIAAEAVDILQIPPSLCAQPIMLLALAIPARSVNVKKGSFWPLDMPNVVCQDDISTWQTSASCSQNATSFGYQTRCVRRLRRPAPNGRPDYPSVRMPTHSVQQPGGQRRFELRTNGEFCYQSDARAAVAIAVRCRCLSKNLRRTPQVRCRRLVAPQIILSWIRMPAVYRISWIEIRRVLARNTP